MKRFLAMLLVCLFAVTALASGTDWFNGSFEEAKVEAAKQDKLVLMFFYAQG
jgi:hypothetical protein